MAAKVYYPFASPPDGELNEETTNAPEPEGAEFGGGDEPPSEPPAIDPKERKLAARKRNESTKLVASALSSAGVGLIGTAFIQPFLKNPALLIVEGRASWYLTGLGLHVVAHLILRWELRMEE